MADVVVKVDFYQWKRMPEKLKEIALKQGFKPSDGVIAVKTIITDEEQRKNPQPKGDGE